MPPLPPPRPLPPAAAVVSIAMVIIYIPMCASFFSLFFYYNVATHRFYTGTGGFRVVLRDLWRWHEITIEYIYIYIYSIAVQLFLAIDLGLWFRNASKTMMKKKFVGQKSDLGVIPFSVCFVWRSQKNWVRINTTKEKTHARLGLQQQQKKTGLDLRLFPRLFFHSFGRSGWRPWNVRRSWPSSS